VHGFVVQQTNLPPIASAICQIVAMLAPVDSTTLTIAQAKRMYDALAPTLGYLTRLRQRMEQVGFIPGDPLYRDVCKAHDAMHALLSRLHYLTCKSGVGIAAGPDHPSSS
jgi:hypothetical protein